jgi:hypothetical protein
MTELIRTLEEFVARCREPVLIEPGQEPIRLMPGQHEWSVAAGRVLIEAWDDSGRLARKVRSITRQAPGEMTLETERFGKKTGTLLVVDRGRPAVMDASRRATRLRLRERFRRFLARQFTGWTIVGLTTETDLENSLSPAYPRAMLARGKCAWAAIAAPDEATAADHILTFGLIWLDYLRRRERRRLTVEGLCLFVPAGKALTTCLRGRWLNPLAAQAAVFIYDADWEEPLDFGSHGNLDTRIEPAAQLPNTPGAHPEQPEAMLEAIVRTNPALFDAKLLPEPVYGQVPAMAGGERGVIDLLAATVAGRLAVLELKASADIHLPLQALDYWLRVRWHQECGDFARHGYFPGLALDPSPPRLIFIAPALQFHPSTETLLRYFSPRVEVTRIGLAVEWKQDLRVMLRLEGARAPD